MFSAFLVKVSHRELMSRLTKNILYNGAGQGLVLLLGMIAVRSIFRQLGEDALGVIYFVLTLNTVLCSSLEMGICSTTVREIAVSFRDKPDYVRDLLRTASLIYWMAYACLALLLYQLAPWLVAHWINLHTMTHASAISTIRVLGAACLLNLPRALYVSVCRGVERMELNNIVDVVVYGLQQVGTVVILLWGGSLMTMVYWQAFGFVFWSAIYMIVAAQLLSWSAVLPGFSIYVVRRNLTFSGHMAAVSALGMVHMQSDKVIVSKILTVGQLGAYGSASLMVSKASTITSAVSLAAFPTLSASFETGGHKAALAQYRKLHDLICVGTIPLFAAIVVATPSLFSHLLSPAVAHELVVPILFLCVGTYMNGTLNMPYFFSLAVGKPEIAVKMNLVALITTTLPAVWLVYRFGLRGAGFSWILYHVSAYAYGIPRFCTECLELPTRDWLVHVGEITAIGAIAYGGAWLLIVHSSIRYETIGLIVAYFISSAVFLLGSYWFIDTEFRRIMEGIAMRVWRRSFGLEVSKD